MCYKARNYNKKWCIDFFLWHDPIHERKTLCMTDQTIENINNK